MIYNVRDAEFKSYGCMLDGYDFSELFDSLAKTDIPIDGIEYVPSEKLLENCAIAKEFRNRGFGGYPIQLGYVNGKNRTLNCLEYHKSSEFNIAMNDMILVLGAKTEITDGKFDSSACKAFYVPAGTGVELYATTLHYAPFNVNVEGYRVVCVLPKGTNEPKSDFLPKNIEDNMCFAVNKWLLAHPEANEVKAGAYVGIEGKNITYEDCTLEQCNNNL